MKTLGIAVVLLTLGVAAAQESEVNKKASVSGVVRDAVTGAPLRGYLVFTYTNATWLGDTIMQTKQTEQPSVTTDDSGRYTLSDLLPGDYRIQCHNQQSIGLEETRWVVLSGTSLEGIDFRVKVPGTISGRVRDENGEPVPGLNVRLYARSYYLGVLRLHPVAALGRTDDEGKYEIAPVQPGHAFLLLADKAFGKIQAMSEAPRDPKFRRKTQARTWYPGTTSSDAAMPIVLRSGEHREGMDIEVKRTANYCIEGTTEGLNGPAASQLQLEVQGNSGLSATGGIYFASPTAKTGPDGKFRVCDLFPGTYMLTAYEGTQGNKIDGYSATTIDISDNDLTGARLIYSPAVALDGEIVLDGPVPERPLSVKANVSLGPLFRTNFGENTSGRFDIPSQFTLNPLLSDYSLRVFVSRPGLYVKSATYGDHDVLYSPLRVGSAMAGSPFRVVIGQDGAKVVATVTDKDGKPVDNARILVIPQDAATEGELAARIVQGQTNQMGSFTSRTIAPGKYYVAACDESVEPTPESVGKVWRARNRFQEVVVTAGGSAQVTLTPITLE